ncbi:hypothetical protein FRX31_014249 [Thalictrum thalictroides]|uniref:Uncharacterized protein n=1 Tax=Thalictrum thalictroides TaxID=46969 RepID=A0A7J6WIB6_THATH|nr:hypothetical protein FRX31_014249 [Thalictrum thalictroides]
MSSRVLGKSMGANSICSHMGVMERAWPGMYENLFVVQSVEEWLKTWPKGCRQEFGKRVWELTPFAVIWVLWKGRNHKIFRNKELVLENIKKEVKLVLDGKLGWKKKTSLPTITA